MTRTKCSGTKKDGTPCSLYAIPDQKCCRFHETQARCQKTMTVHVDESTFQESDTQQIVKYVTEQFPLKTFYRQVNTDNVLEDFATALVKEVLLKLVKRKWNCIVGRDGQFGLVGSLNEEYETDLCILTVELPQDGFMIYVF